MGGPSENVFSERPLYELFKVTDTVLLFWCSTDGEPILYSYDSASGKTELITDRLFGGDIFVTGGRAVYPVAEPETGRASRVRTNKLSRVLYHVVLIEVR